MYMYDNKSLKSVPTSKMYISKVCTSVSSSLSFYKEEKHLYKTIQIYILDVGTDFRLEYLSCFDHERG